MRLQGWRRRREGRWTACTSGQSAVEAMQSTSIQIEMCWIFMTPFLSRSCRNTAWRLPRENARKNWCAFDEPHL